MAPKLECLVCLRSIIQRNKVFYIGNGKCLSLQQQQQHWQQQQRYVNAHYLLLH
jgi:hypothetical protein